MIMNKNHNLSFLLKFFIQNHTVKVTNHFNLFKCVFIYFTAAKKHLKKGQMNVLRETRGKVLEFCGQSGRNLFGQSQILSLLPGSSLNCQS